MYCMYVFVYEMIIAGVIYVSCIIESDCITSMSSLHEIEDTCHNSKFQM